MYMQIHNEGIRPGSCATADSDIIGMVINEGSSKKLILCDAVHSVVIDVV